VCRPRALLTAPHRLFYRDRQEEWGRQKQSVSGDLRRKVRDSKKRGGWSNATEISE